VPQLSAARPVVTVEVRVPSLAFYLGRAPELVELHDLDGRLQRDDGALYVFVDVDLPSVRPPVIAALHEVGRYGKYVVFEKNHAKSGE
jgi:hypothetical protein